MTQSHHPVIRPGVAWCALPSDGVSFGSNPCQGKAHIGSCMPTLFMSECNFLDYDCT